MQTVPWTPSNLRAKSRTTNAFAQRPLCAPAEPLLRCRGPYCAAMVTLRRPLCGLLGHQANAKRRCLFWVCSKWTPSLVVLWDPNASNGDATALLRWCLRYYCALLGVLHFFRTPWDHHEDAALVWQGFNILRFFTALKMIMFRWNFSYFWFKTQIVGTC